jgi:hypothetical protein
MGPVPKQERPDNSIAFRSVRFSSVVDPRLADTLCDAEENISTVNSSAKFVFALAIFIVVMVSVPLNVFGE